MQWPVILFLACVAFSVKAFAIVNVTISGAAFHDQTGDSLGNVTATFSYELADFSLTSFDINSRTFTSTSPIEITVDAGGPVFDIDPFTTAGVSSTPHQFSFSGNSSINQWTDFTFSGVFTTPLANDFETIHSEFIADLQGGSPKFTSSSTFLTLATASGGLNDGDDIRIDNPEFTFAVPEASACILIFFCGSGLALRHSRPRSRG